VLLTGGGIISKEDMEKLRKMGVGRLFGPGTPTYEIVNYIREWYEKHRKPKREAEKNES
jgi:methylmalonyl-CoA mutase C-terminal domain/subunit